MPVPVTATVTVGSTQFAALTDAVLSRKVLDALCENGVEGVTVQHGSSSIKGREDIVGEYRDRLRIACVPFTPSIEETIAASQLVISHAGSQHGA